jgi:hypothetical protein
MATPPDFVVGQVLTAAEMTEVSRISSGIAVNRVMSVNNTFTNQTTFADVPQAADAAALQISFTKLRADTSLLISISAPVFFTSGSAQNKFWGLSIAGTDYTVAASHFANATSAQTMSGTRVITGLSAGAKTIKPRFATGTASTDIVVGGCIISYSVIEVFV